ncbi:glycosyl transferase, partial [Streptomyces griseocarneus]
MVGEVWVPGPVREASGSGGSGAGEGGTGEVAGAARAKRPSGRPRILNGPYDYGRFSVLAGELGGVPVGGYRVGFRRLWGCGGGWWLGWLVGGAPLFGLGLLVWLLWPVHWVVRGGWLGWVDGLMLVCVGLVEVFRVVNVVSVAHASWVARDPVPVVAPS